MHSNMHTLFQLTAVPIRFKASHGRDCSCHCLERNRPSDGSIRRHQWYVHILFLNCIQTSRELTPFLQCLNRFLFCSHVVYFLLEVFNWCENLYEWFIKYLITLKCSSLIYWFASYHGKIFNFYFFFFCIFLICLPSSYFSPWL